MGVSSIMKAAGDDWVIIVDNGNFVKVTAPNQSHLTIKAATKDCSNIYDVQSKIDELNKLTSKAMEEAVYYIDDDEAMREMEADRPKYVPANSLPEGWNWEQYNDGSGGLYGPDGEDYFHYDLATVPGGVEYMQTSDHPWDAFYGSFSEFKEYAESVVNSLYIAKTVEKEEVQYQESIPMSENTPDNESAEVYSNTVVSNDIKISAGKINSTPKWSVTDDIKASGYKPTKKLVSCMEKVNDAAGKHCSIRNLKGEVKKHSDNTELKKAATGALRELNRQERCSAIAQALHLPVK